MAEMKTLMIPTGEAWAVVNQHDLVATFGSAVALRKGGWL
jgi:hypothetical protein